jgi:glutathione synthase/RimK-type ligase-like ATP-grasp enzyme
MHSRAALNIVFLSPAFPPTAPAFCSALAQQGVTVLGIGDEPVPPELAQAWGLSAYVHEPHMADDARLKRAVAELIARFGRIDRVDSNGEHWLDAEARLRDEFGIAGLDAKTLAQQRSKLGMAELFAAADIPHPPGVSCRDPAAVQDFARAQGFPLVLKPDRGSGARDTFRVENEAELTLALARDLREHLAQPFIPGDIVTYDGLCDRQGRIVFSTAHTYDTGIMQVRLGNLDGHYLSLRELPPGLEDLGRRAVAAFDVRERFFHVEFFQRASGGFTALEMNLRPPGGFTTDMMNAACNIDVYELWAKVMTGRDLDGFTFERQFHTAHAGRRKNRRYLIPAAELRIRLGGVLASERDIPAAFADTMGDTMYLLRHRDLSELKRAIEQVQRVEP